MIKSRINDNERKQLLQKLERCEWLGLLGRKEYLHLLHALESGAAVSCTELNAAERGSGVEWTVTYQCIP